MSSKLADTRQHVAVKPAVTSVRAATLAEWKHAFETCEHATFLHGPRWSELWQAYTAGRYRPSRRRIEFSDGLVAVLNLTAKRPRLGIEKHHLDALTDGVLIRALNHRSKQEVSER